MKNPAADIIPGSMWQGPYGKVRVMATAEGWVMARAPGCVAWCEGHKEFRRNYRQIQVNAQGHEISNG